MTIATESKLFRSYDTDLKTTRTVVDMEKLLAGYPCDHKQKECGETPIKKLARDLLSPYPTLESRPELVAALSASLSSSLGNRQSAEILTSRFADALVNSTVAHNPARRMPKPELHDMLTDRFLSVAREHHAASHSPYENKPSDKQKPNSHQKDKRESSINKDPIQEEVSKQLAQGIRVRTFIRNLLHREKKQPNNVLSEFDKELSEILSGGKLLEQIKQNQTLLSEIIQHAQIDTTLPYDKQVAQAIEYIQQTVRLEIVRMTLAAQRATKESAAASVQADARVTDASTEARERIRTEQIRADEKKERTKIKVDTAASIMGNTFIRVTTEGIRIVVRTSGRTVGALLTFSGHAGQMIGEIASENPKIVPPTVGLLSGLGFGCLSGYLTYGLEFQGIAAAGGTVAIFGMTTGIIIDIIWSLLTRR